MYYVSQLINLLTRWNLSPVNLSGLQIGSGLTLILQYGTGEGVLDIVKNHQIFCRMKLLIKSFTRLSFSTISTGSAGRHFSPLDDLQPERMK